MEAFGSVADGICACVCVYGVCVCACVSSCVHCVSFLLLCHHTITNLVVQDSSIYYPSFSGWGFWAQLCWVLYFSVSPESCNQNACWGCSLISNLHWSRIHVQVRMIVGRIQFLIVYCMEGLNFQLMAEVPCHVGLPNMVLVLSKPARKRNSQEDRCYHVMQYNY